MDVHAKRKNLSTRDFVYQTLREQIVQLIWEPGKSISEKEAADQLGVSRTPVREAFLQLSQEELLEVYPQKGTYVSLIDLSHVEEGRFMREHLEKGVVELACDRFSGEDLYRLESILKMQEFTAAQKNYSKLFELDEEFHGAIFAACRKERVWRLVQRMNVHFNRIRMLRLAKDLNWDVILSQHRQIFQAIRDKDKVRARQVITEHLRLVDYEKEGLVQKYPNYFAKS